MKREIDVNLEYVDDEYDAVTLRFAERAEDYVRIDSLDEDTRLDVLKLLRRRRNLTLEGIPETLELPPTGVDWILGGTGPAIISLSGRVLKVVPLNENVTSEHLIPVDSAARGLNGIQFIVPTGQKLIFSFSARPVPPHPAWDAAFPIRDV